MRLANWLDTNVLTDEATRLARLTRQVTSQISELSQRRDILSGEVAAFDKLIGQLQKTRNEHLTELAALDRKVSINRELSTQAQAELDALTTAIESARATVAALENEATTLEQQIAVLTQHHATLQAATPAIEATQAQAQAEATEAARVELARIVAATEAAREQLTQAQDDRARLKQDAIAEAEAEISLARRQFELETAIAIQNVEASKFEALKEIQSNEMSIVERWREALTEPLQAELDAAQVEIGRLARLLAAKRGDSLEWQLEQVKALLVRSLEDGTVRPNHLRIAGESESGKSHLVNQLITSGVAAMGLGVDIELYDPYPSDTTWEIAPTIADDPEAIAARLVELKELCQSPDRAKLARPLIVVVDECDALILQFKGAVTEALKVILKRGRHCNVILWMLGQNANVKALGWDWSDIKNAGGVYLNQVGYDYAKNGMAGRNTGIVGELDAIASRYPYYALIHPKGAARPYAVAVPKVLFPTAKAATEAATEAQGIAQGVGKVACPKCKSDRTKSNGKALEGKRRIYCNNCGKSSTVSA